MGKRVTQIERAANWRDVSYVYNGPDIVTDIVTIIKVGCSKGHAFCESSNIRGKWCFDAKPDAIIYSFENKGDATLFKLFFTSDLWK